MLFLPLPSSEGHQRFGAKHEKLCEVVVDLLRATCLNMNTSIGPEKHQGSSYGFKKNIKNWKVFISSYEKRWKPFCHTFFILIFLYKWMSQKSPPSRLRSWHLFTHPILWEVRRGCLFCALRHAGIVLAHQAVSVVRRQSWVFHPKQDGWFWTVKTGGWWFFFDVLNPESFQKVITVYLVITAAFKRFGKPPWILITGKMNSTCF